MEKQELTSETRHPLVIALAGFKGSGKDTVCELLMAHFPNAKHLAFADPIKRRIMEALDLRPSEYDKMKRQTFRSGELEIKGRDIVRMVGMTMRSYNPEQFINDVCDEINVGYESGVDTFIISDLRFDNEVRWLYTLQAHSPFKVVIIKVTRPDVTSDGHVSEQEIPDDQCSIVLNNDGNIQQLEEEVSQIVALINQ